MRTRRVDMKAVCQELRGIRDDEDYLDALLFGPERAPNGECHLERNKIIERLQVLGVEFGEPRLDKLYLFLREEQRGYMPREDGVSRCMQILDDIDALVAVEAEERGRAANVCN